MALFNCNTISLKLNSSGEQVKTLQTNLKKLGYYTTSNGYYLKIDGKYGTYTKKAVESFQRKNGLKVDGIFGTQTCKKFTLLLEGKTENKTTTEPKKVETKTTNTTTTKQTVKTVYKDFPTPDYLKQISFSLTVLKDMIVLPTALTDENSNNTNVVGGATSVSADFNCTKIDLKYGSSGDDVTKLQNILKAKGYYTRQVDGSYGTYTKKGVVKLQKSLGVKEDGAFGSVTCEALKKSMNPNSTSDSSQKNGGNVVLKIDEFKTQPSFSSDIEGLTNDVSLQIMYSNDVLTKLKQFQKTEFRVYEDSEESYLHEGYISSVKVTTENNTALIDISINGYSAFLEKTVEIDKTAKRSELIKYIAELCDLKANVDMTGFTDSEYTLKTQSEKTTTSSGEGAGATMTLDEIYAIAAKFSYHGQGTGTCPQKAYNLYQKGVRSFDCYDATNWLCYMLHTFAKVKCRNVQTYSPYSLSKTHRIAQIWQNGGWVTPKQAYNMTKKLKPFTPWDSQGSVVVKYVLEVDDEISC